MDQANDNIALTSAPGAYKALSVHLQEASMEQRRQLLDLLSANKLPINDITEGVTLYALLLGDKVVGSAGLERYGTKALLRSISVADSVKGKGLGIYISQQLEHLARQEGVDELYLVTTTADRFFAKFGYRLISRSEVAEAVAVSGQFNGICPASAAIMVKALQPA